MCDLLLRSNLQITVSDLANGSMKPHFSISGRVDRASASEAVDSASIFGRVKPKAIKIGIHSLPP